MVLLHIISMVLFLRSATFQRFSFDFKRNVSPKLRGTVFRAIYKPHLLLECTVSIYTILRTTDYCCREPISIVVSSPGGYVIRLIRVGRCPALFFDYAQADFPIWIVRALSLIWPWVLNRATYSTSDWILVRGGYEDHFELEDQLLPRSNHILQRVFSKRLT